ncbi:MAG: hypothetical protein U1C55_10095 [Smithellaceae bacterium]|nr:hypothetical protein [Smithellaceae bacterium]
MAQRLFQPRLISLIMGIALLFSLLACAPKPRQQASQLDTPQHHTFTGIRLLNQENYAEAEKSFNLALQLEAKYSQAHAGLGLVRAYQGNFKAGLESVEAAIKHAKTNEDKVFAQVGVIRVNTLSRADCMRVGVVCKRSAKDWLENSEEAFDKVMAIDPKSAYAYHYMGLCYKTALDFQKAGYMFSKVLDLKGDYVKEADGEWNIVQKIQRAMPGTSTGKQIAFVEKITRADAAALFMEEMKIEVLYQKRTPKTFDTAFRAPDAPKPVERVIAPNDIGNHPLKADIEGIIKLGVRGLETYPDGSFKPDVTIDRAAYAMMLEDILIKVSGDNTLATKFIGQVSPFPDLRSDLPYFNAVMVATTRGIMGVKDFTSGEFAPLATVPGVDGLLSIRMMKEALKF